MKVKINEKEKAVKEITETVEISSVCGNYPMPTHEGTRMTRI